MGFAKCVVTLLLTAFARWFDQWFPYFDSGADGTGEAGLLVEAQRALSEHGFVLAVQVEEFCVGEDAATCCFV